MWKPPRVERAPNRLEQAGLLDSPVGHEEHTCAAELMRFVRALGRCTLAREHSGGEAPQNQIRAVGHSLPTRLSISA